MFRRRADRGDFDDFACNVDALDSERCNRLTGRDEGIESRHLGRRDSENGAVLKQYAVDVTKRPVKQHVNATRQGLPFGNLRDRGR